MKNYQVTFQVPNDFDPNELELVANYPKAGLEISGEGFFDVDKIAESLTMAPINVNKSSVLIFKYPKSIALGAPILAEMLKDSMEKALGCTVIGVLDDFEFMVQNSAEATATLKQMIDKINSKAIIKLA